MKYEVKGEPMPVVICTLEAGERMITESGSMVWMSPNMQMDTSAGGLGKAFGRMFSGENIFQNIYTAQGGPGLIAFAASFPGSIRAIEITPDKPVVCQKAAFLAATDGVQLSVFFQNKALTGFFGGEGFIMQKLSGHGIAFIEIDGSAVEYRLEAGQRLIVDTGNVAMMDSTVSMKRTLRVRWSTIVAASTKYSGPFCIVIRPRKVTTFSLPVWSGRGMS